MTPHLHRPSIQITFVFPNRPTYRDNGTSWKLIPRGALSSESKASPSNPSEGVRGTRQRDSEREGADERPRKQEQIPRVRIRANDWRCFRSAGHGVPRDAASWVGRRKIYPHTRSTATLRPSNPPWHRQPDVSPAQLAPLPSILSFRYQTTWCQLWEKSSLSAGLFPPREEGRYAYAGRPGEQGWPDITMPMNIWVGLAVGVLASLMKRFDISVFTSGAGKGGLIGSRRVASWVSEGMGWWLEWKCCDKVARGAMVSKLLVFVVFQAIA